MDITMYPPDQRDTTPKMHSLPTHGEVFVKSLGFAGFKFGTCVGLEIQASPDGKVVRSWRACISDGMETASHVANGDEWTWNTWHSVRDDAEARKQIESLEAAKAIQAGTPAPTAEKPKATLVTPDAKKATDLRAPA